jgi:probable HAF family extracellular repeat protein
VTGSMAAPNGFTHAFRLDGGSFTDLGSLVGPTGTSVGRGVSAGGNVTGSSTSAAGPAHAFVTIGSTMLDLGVLPGYTTSEGTAVNSGGLVTGFSSGPGLPTRAFVSSGPGGALVDLGTLGGNFSQGNAISEAGRVAGVSTVRGGASHAFRSGASGGGLEDLGTLPGGSTSVGLGINADGQVTGFSDGPGSGFHAFVTQGSTMIDLGTLGGGTTSFGLGLNGQGHVVGRSSIAGGAFRGFLWTPAKDGNPAAMTDLNAFLAPGSGWVLTDAQAIDENGIVVGLGLLNGQSHAYRLIPDHLVPIPAPPAFALAAIGGACVAARERHRRRRAGAA